MPAVPAPEAPPAPDPFADLDALAAQGDGRLWHAVAGNVWTFAGCPVDRRANLQMPLVSVPDARVQAALAAGAWGAAVLDTHARPPAILAVQKAPSEGEAVRVLTAADLGTPAAAT